MRTWSVVAGAALVAVTIAEGAWKPGLYGGMVAGTLINKTAFPTVTNVFSGPHTATTAVKPPWADYTTWVYWGQVYLPAATIWFAENIDDAVYMRIWNNGTPTVVLDHGVWNTPSAGFFTAPSADWYPVEIRFYNGGGGAGPVPGSGWTSTFGFGYKIGGGSSVNGADYVYPTDNGAMSLFRHDDGLGFDNALLITGVPMILGMAVPPYGYTNNLAAGNVFPCSVTAAGTNAASDTRYTCSGWRLYQKNGNYWQLASQGAGAEMTYTHVMAERRLDWQFAVEYLCPIAAGAGGTVTTNGGWYPYHAPITVTALPAAGKVFRRWNGDLPEALAWNPELTLTADQPRTLAAEFGDILHVSAARPDDTGDGASWATAFRTVGAALAAAGDGHTILVSNGTYAISAPLAVGQGITLEGAGTRPEDVVISRASGDIRLLTINHAKARVTWLTFTGGQPAGNNSGGNVLISTAGGRLESCIVRNGRCSYGARGSGVHVDSPAGTVTHCVITNNEAFDVNNNGGMGLSMTGGRVSECLVAGNYQTRNQVGTQVRGAVYISGGTLVNCTIVDNESQTYAGVYATGGLVANCVIARNRSKNLGGSASVFGGNAAAFVDCVSDTLAINAECTSGELRFARPRAGDYRLILGSAHGPATAPFAFSGTVVPGSGGNLCTWDFGDGTPPVAGSNLLAVSHTYAGPGIYAVSLTVTNGGASAACVLPGAVEALAGAIHVVPGAGAGAPPYADWATAAPTLGEALAFAGDGDTILLTNGTHTVTDEIRVFQGIVFRGASGRPEEVIVQRGGNSHRIFRISHPDARLDALTVRNGYQIVQPCHNGGGILIDVFGGTVTNCIVRDNRCFVPDAQGAGIMLNGPGLVTHCVIRDNTCDDNGASSGGSGVALNHSEARVEQCLIVNNVTALAHGIEGRELNPCAGGARVVSGLLTSCTLAGNRSLNVGGVHALGGSIYNCLIAGNVSEGPAGADWAEVYGGYSGCFANCLGDTALINGTCRTGDPGFVDATAGDHHLRPDSPAIDAGTWPPRGLPGGDLDGQPRLSHVTVDIGAYEFQVNGLTAGFSVTPPAGPVPLAAAFTASVLGVAGPAIDYAWDFGDGSPVATNASPMHVYTAPGDYTVTLTVHDGFGSATATRTEVVRSRPPVLHVVSGHAGAAPPYDGWTNAAATIAEAVAGAVDGCTVLVSNGTYLVTAETIIDKGIHVHGIGATPEGVLVQRTGAGSLRLFRLNHPRAQLSNLAISGGTGNALPLLHGANVLIAAQGGTLSDCVLRNGNFEPLGCGAYVNSGAGLVVRCVITNNWCNHVTGKGGLGVGLAAGRVENCLIARNYVLPSLTTTTPLGAVRMTGGALVNCTVVDNEANTAPGVYCAGGAVTNCLIAGNRSRNYPASGAWSVYCNLAASVPRFAACLSPELQINAGCILADPGFVDGPAGNWRPAKGSAPVDAGLDVAAGLLDLDRKARLLHKRIDIGCYEFPYTPPGVCIILR